jgi:hypothetical protein
VSVCDRTSKSEEDKIFGGYINKPIVLQNLKSKTNKKILLNPFPLLISNENKTLQREKAGFV